MAFDFFKNDTRMQVSPSTTASKKRRTQAAPEAPELEAAPVRDMASEASQRLRGSILASAIAALLSPRRGLGVTAKFLQGGQAGADAKFGNELADNQRTNQTAMAQYGANRQRFGDDRALDAMDFQQEQAQLGQERWQKGYDRQGEQIQYGRGRDAVGDAFRADQASRRNMEADRSWSRTLGLDEQQKRIQGVQLFSTLADRVAGFDDKSQSAFRAGVNPGLKYFDTALPEAPLRPAPKPVDPYKMGMLKLQYDKLKQLKFWQKGQLGLGSQRAGNAAANTQLRASELGLRTSMAAFQQQLQAAQMQGIDPESALRFSLQAQQLSTDTGLDPSDQQGLRDIAANLQAIARGESPESQGTAPSTSPYVLPGFPSSGNFRGVNVPTPTVGGGYTPPSRPVTGRASATSRVQKFPTSKPVPKPAAPKVKASEKKRLTSGF